MNAPTKSLKHLTPLHQTIGMIFEAVNRQAYHDYLRIFHRQLDITPLYLLDTTPRMCFMGIAVNRNNEIVPQKHVKDFRDGWVVMCCFGNCEGGELCLPTLKITTPEGEKEGVRIRYGLGDVVLFRATLFEYWLSGYEGPLTNLVYHTPQVFVEGYDEDEGVSVA